MTQESDAQNLEVTPPNAATARNSDPGDEINLIDMAIVLAKHKWLVIVFPLFVAIVSAVVSLNMPNIYTATARILPPQNQSSVSATLAQLGTLGALAGIAGAGAGLRSPNDLFIGMIKSRTVADSMIARFELRKIYGQELQSSTRAVLEGKTAVTTGKDGIITIDVDDEDPKRASDLANAYVDELVELTKVLAVTEASKRRLFFEQQLGQARESLMAAEIATRQGLEKGGLAKVDDQGRAMVEVTARLRAQISVKEVQIGAMRTFAADRNPELRMAQEELSALKRELSRIEGASPVATIGKIREEGSSGLENLGRLRDVKYFETLYELLAKQYELAKIDEAKDPAVIQVLDKAIIPDRKSKPWRARIVVLSALAAFFVAILWAFILEAKAKVKSDPAEATRLEILQSYLRWK